MTGLLRPVAIATRICLAAGFLSAVADRFGLWGRKGTGNVSWGNFDTFVDYVGKLAPYLPQEALHAVGWAATITEVLLGVGLLLGVALGWIAGASAVVLTVFGLSMLLFSGPEAPLSYSVFAAACAAALLAVISTNREQANERPSNDRPPGTSAR